MSKELTEKWKQGKLESDAYYTKIKDPLCPAFVCVNEYFKDDECPEFRDYPDEWIIEVLDKVPSYEEYQALLCQLSSISEQLKDANEVIKWYATGDLSDWEYVDGEEVFVEQSAANETDTAEKYLKKYGVEK